MIPKKKNPKIAKSAKIFKKLKVSKISSKEETVLSTAKLLKARKPKQPKKQRTGKYKGYAFVEFTYSDVAKIVAETMNNYLMYKKVIKAKYLPAEEQKPYAFKFLSFKVPLSVRRKRFQRQRSNRILTEEQSEKERIRLDHCIEKKMNKLEKLGISYKFQIIDSKNMNSEETTT